MGMTCVARPVVDGICSRGFSLVGLSSPPPFHRHVGKGRGSVRVKEERCRIDGAVSSEHSFGLRLLARLGTACSSGCRIIPRTGVCTCSIGCDIGDGTSA